MNDALTRLSNKLIGTVRRRVSRSRQRRIVLIVNPASGQDRPILKSINTVLRESGAQWDLLVTKNAGDGYRLAQKAVAAGVDTVGVYGGDGTVTQVASGLSGTRVELGILPGGTGNMIATALGISRDFTQALQLMAQREHLVRRISLGQVNRQAFFQMVGIGLEARMIAEAGRESKDRLGFLAYGLAAINAMVNAPVAHYRLELDGQEIEIDGVTCLILHAENLVPGVNIPAITASPPMPRRGLLDVLVIRKADLTSVVSIAATVAGAGLNVDLVPHWQAHRVAVFADPPQPVQSDGEILGKTPVSAHLARQTVSVIVPSQPNLVVLSEEEDDEMASLAADSGAGPGNPLDLGNDLSP